MLSKKQKKNSSDINAGHYLELLDRTHVACMMINDHLVEHPLSDKDKEIRFQLEYALGQLYDAYQLIGHKQHIYENENNAHK
jgi:hypothetical protein